jgi:hypothetical protein
MLNGLKSFVESASFQRLKLKYCSLRSSFAFHVNLRHYATDGMDYLSDWTVCLLFVVMGRVCQIRLATSSHAF